MSGKMKGVLCALIANIIFGFSYLFSKTALAVASPIVLIASRFLLATLIMSVLALTGAVKVSFKGKGKHLPQLLLLALFQPILYFIFETYGLSMCSTTFSSITFAFMPLMSVLFAFVILKERPTRLQLVFCCVALIAVIGMAFIEKNGGQLSLLGAVLMMGSRFCAVGFNIMSRKLSDVFSAFERTYAMMGLSTVVFVIMALVMNINAPEAIITPFTDTGYIVSVLYLGGLSSILAFLLTNMANNHLTLARATAFSNIITVVSVVSGIVILKEDYPPVPTALLCLCVIVGVWGVQRFAPQTDKKGL